MEMTKTRVNTRSIAAAISITAVIALLYYWLTVSAPGLSFSAFGFETPTYRIGNSLKVFALSSPFAAIGYTLGLTAVDVHSGKFAFGLYLTAPMVTLFCGLMAYRLSHKWGRAWWKDLMLIALWSIITMTHIALIRAAVTASILQLDFWLTAKTVFILKAPTNLVSSLAGYPLFAGVQEIIKVYRSRFDG